MMDHLPECQRWFTDMPEPDECPACEILRTCEQRVTDEVTARLTKAYEWVVTDERSRTLDAAREAVLNVTVRKDTSWDHRVCALAAIDALREATK